MDEKVIIEVSAPSSMVNKKEKKTAGLFPLLLSVEEIFKFPLPVKSSFNKKNNKSHRFPMLLSIQFVLGWAFVAAFSVAVAFGIGAAMVFADIPVPCSQTSKFFQCPDLTPAQEAKVDFFFEEYLCLTVPQAAAATMGLLFPRRHARGRWSLALVAIASTTVAHYMNARTASVFIAANQGHIGYNILVGGGAVVYLVLDLLGLLSLLVGSEEPTNYNI